MKLLDISDPINKTDIEEEISSPAVGIDLGTTNSLVAISTEQNASIIPLDNGKDSLPSIVSYASNIVVGCESGEESEVVIRSVKRLMGKNINDVNIDDLLLSNLIDNSVDNSQTVNLKVAPEKSVTAIEVSAEILQKLRLCAEVNLGQDISKAVITVPAYFDDAARNATKQAAQLAGLEVLRLINEPTAAALAYGLDNQHEGVYVVYDLGGGTFDVSILDMQKGIFKVLATAGDTNLGGDDFDSIIAADIFTKYIGDNLGKDFSPKEQYELHHFAREIKETLSNQDSYQGEIILNDQAYQVSYKRSDLDILCKPLIDKTFNILERAIKDSKKTLNEIQEVILVGGSTKMPCIRSRLKEFFAKEPLCTINPEQVVALGAALQAEALTYGTNNLLVDVVPLSLGIETMGGMVEKIIERNSPVPAHAFQEFTTYEDNQQGLVIHILQGERELVEQNRSLAKFVLNNLPPMPAGKPRIRINFQIDRDGLLTVSAREMTSNVEQEIQVKPSFGLDEEKLLELLRESMANAKSDMKERLVAKYKFEIAEQVKAILHLIEKEPEFFTQEQIINAKEFAKQRLSFIERQPDFEELQKHHAGTKQYLDDLAVAKVEFITKSLRGKNVAELNKIFKEKDK